jgi:ubiquinol-cytochrome c reductase cytochrome b subunit
MSLWGIKMPQMYSLELFLFAIVFITIINLTTNIIANKIRGMYRIGPHNKDVLSIIYGSLLGDAHAEKRLSGVGTRISFFQEDTHLKYIFYLHNLLSKAGYCNDKLPIVKERLGVKDKVRKIVRFSTWTYTSFNWIHDEWYINGRKCVPNNIDKYLTPLALAIWIMDDGAKVGKGLKFSTNSFTYSECIHLVNILYKNFSLKASVQSAGIKDQYIIYIWKESMNDLLNIVSPYIIPEMKYKII